MVKVTPTSSGEYKVTLIVQGREALMGVKRTWAEADAMAKRIERNTNG
jgi:hypothetical protein